MMLEMVAVGADGLVLLTAGAGGQTGWANPLAFVRAVRSVCWVPGDPAGAIVHALKYDGWTALADPIGERMARVHWPADVVVELTAYVPVPLAAARHRERGFNQAELLARAVARRHARPVWTDLLTRARFSATQTRLTPPERAANVHQAFRVNPVARGRIAGTHLVLVDDVLTTGATVNAAATARTCASGTFEDAISARSWNSSDCQSTRKARFSRAA